MEPLDTRVLDDVEYAAALDRCSELQRIGEQAARELAGWQTLPTTEANRTRAAAEIEVER